ncbi:YccF domain-containing protein [Halorubrum sp. HHNYT27]|uniref:YccF domain-containing protein n=1 Tax=Halorubrum sp. HHNYT27 TaxID=3402275 RepID=UPI003EBB4C31
MPGEVAVFFAVADAAVRSCLRPSDSGTAEFDDADVPPEDLPQATTRRSLLVRALWFVFVGWWLSLLWANVASFLAITVVGLPVAIRMLNRLPYVTSLSRFHG